MLRHQVKQDITWNIKQELSTRLSFNYHANNNYSNSGRSGRTLGLLIDTIYVWIEKRSSFFAGAAYEDNSATNHDYYYHQWTGKLGTAIGLPWEFNLSITGKYDDKRYDYEDSAYGIRRVDQKYNVASVLSRKIYVDWLSAELEYSYTRNNANIDVYEYDRNLFSVSIVGRY